MNILFLGNPAPQYKQFFGPLASLMEEDGHQVFFAIDSRKSCYTDPQVFIDQHPNTFFMDDFAKNYVYQEKAELIQKYSWGDLFFSDIDRFLTHDYNHFSAGHFYYLLHLINDFLFQVIKENRIDLVMYENVANSYEKIAYDLCGDFGIPYIGLVCSRIPSKFEMQKTYLSVSDEIKQHFTVSPDEENIQWAEQYIANLDSIQPDYMAANGADVVTFQHFFGLSKLNRIFRHISSDIKVKDIPFQRKSFLEVIRVYLQLNVRRYLKSKIVLKFYQESDCINDKYYLYPIHYHPEASTSILAPSYVDEYNNIVNIAMSLPMGTFLYVKDHKSGFASHPYWFHKKVSQLPNVKLIKPSENSKTLIKSALAIITVTSTVGYEAVLLSKPVFLLGCVFYEQFNGVTKVSSFVDLKEKISIIENYSFDVEMTKLWLIAYKNFCYSGSLNLSRAPNKEVSSSILSFIQTQS